MRFICNHAGDYRPCAQCQFAQPFTAEWHKMQVGRMLEPAPGRFSRILAANRYFSVRHTMRVNCPHAKGLHAPIRLLEVP